MSERPHKKVLVCGGRTFTDDDLVNNTLTKLLETYDIECIIEGDAPGADRLAGTWARNHAIPNFKYPADWNKQGKAAGPLRNAKMLLDGRPNLVVAFPGGRGTADMVRKAKASGVEVIEVS